MATARISELTIGSPLSGSELFEMTQDTTSFSVSAGMIKEYVHKGYAKLSDVKAYNVDGGTFTSGAWRTRDLNTIDYNPQGIVLSLSSNQFTLGPGVYEIKASLPGREVNHNVGRLYNISDSSEVILGSVCMNSSAAAVVTRTIIVGRFTITNTKVFELQHRSDNTHANDGFGSGTYISGINSVYSIAEIWKIN